MSFSKKILVVDDEQNAVEALAKILREDGYQVAVACTEEQAMSRLDESTFDCVITDLFLLRKSCNKLLNTLRSREPRIPVVLVTGHENVDRYVSEYPLEEMTRLSKPIQYDELKRAIAAIQARSGSGKQT